MINTRRCHLPKGQVSSAGPGEAGWGLGLCDLWQRALLPGLDQGACLCTTTPRTSARRASLGRGRHECQSAKLAAGSERASRKIQGNARWSSGEDWALFKLCLGSIPGQGTEILQAPWHGKKKKKCKYSKAHSLPPDQCLGGPCVLRGSLRQGSDTDHPLGVGQGLWQRCCPGEGQGGGRSVTSSTVLLLSWGWGPSVHRGLAPSPPCLPCLPPRPLWVLPRSTKQCTNCRPEIRPFCFLRTGGSLAETPRPSGPLASPQASSR